MWWLEGLIVDPPLLRVQDNWPISPPPVSSFRVSLSTNRKIIEQWWTFPGVAAPTQLLHNQILQPGSQNRTWGSILKHYRPQLRSTRFNNTELRKAMHSKNLSKPCLTLIKRLDNLQDSWQNILWFDETKVHCLAFCYVQHKITTGKLPNFVVAVWLPDTALLLLYQGLNWWSLELGSDPKVLKEILQPRLWP